jgi:hypothetical protein
MPFPSHCVFPSHPLATASNWESFPLHTLRSYLHSLPCRTQLVAPTVLIINSQHRRLRKHCSIAACILVAAGICLPSCCPEMGCMTPFINNLLLQQQVSFRDHYPATGLHVTLLPPEQPTRVVAFPLFSRTVYVTSVTSLAFLPVGKFSQ